MARRGLNNIDCFATIFMDPTPVRTPTYVLNLPPAMDRAKLKQSTEIDTTAGSTRFLPVIRGNEMGFLDTMVQAGFTFLLPRLYHSASDTHSCTSHSFVLVIECHKMSELTWIHLRLEFQ